MVALDELTLDILEGEFFAILGPSGSGKTTCLRLVAGFDRPTSGSIELHGVRADDQPPYARDVNTVFQDYALFPHMTVADNVGYGLMIRKVPRAARTSRVAEMLELVRLPNVGARRPSALSGGQRQRVALARALINRPRVLLLDEPLGALDLRLRQQMQVELKSLQQRLGITFIHVTHDQDEALAMSDRIAVVRDGRLEQVGTPTEVYERPATAFVADFLGQSNLLDGAIVRELTGQDGAISIRPEKIVMRSAGAEAPPGWCRALGRIDDTLYLGSHRRSVVRLDAGPSLIVIEPTGESRSAGDDSESARRVLLCWDPRHNWPVGNS